MKTNDLAKLYTWLWPFQPDYRDFQEPTENPYLVFDRVIYEMKKARPDVFMHMLHIAHEEGPEQANDELLTYIEPLENMMVDAVSQLYAGIMLPGYSSGYKWVGRDDNGNLIFDEVEENFINQEHLEPLANLWDFLWPPPDKEIDSQKMKALLGLAQWLTEVPIPRKMWQGPPLPEPPTERHNLGWLLAWAVSETGYETLDYSSHDVAENGVYYEWDRHNITATFELLDETHAVADMILLGFDVYTNHQAAIHANIERVLKGEAYDACTWPF